MEMDVPEGNGQVHSDHHLDIEIPDTAHQISHGSLSLISCFLLTFFIFYFGFMSYFLRSKVVEAFLLSA